MFLNKEYLTDIAKKSYMDTTNVRDKVLNENGMIYFKKKSYDLFLSHSYLDKSLVYTLVNLFNLAGYSVYVDWKEDPHMDRSKVTPETAKTVRERMRSCYGLAYISTTNIANSKWCPWELGYVDGNKNGRCAILPVLEKKTSIFIGQEYLGIYPYIDYDTNKATKLFEFWVNDPVDKDKYVSLRDWLNGKNPVKHG